MQQEPPPQLQIGRVAFASIFSSTWWIQRRTVLVGCATACTLLLFGLIQFSSLLTPYQLGQKQTAKGSAMESPAAELLPHARAQHYLALGDVKQALLQDQSAREKTEGLLSHYYVLFRKTSLLIGAGHYAQALMEAKQLKIDLDKDDLFWSHKSSMLKSGSILYAYNLMRIATLEHEAGSATGELEAWDELIAHAGWEKNPSQLKTYDPEAYSLLSSNFHKGDVSLRDFIEERRAALRCSH